MTQPFESPKKRLDWYWIAWLGVVLSVAVKVVFAWNVPLMSDEAYYWGWSRHLAFGYIDHPPAVAWLIAAFSWLGREPGIVRLGFVPCGVVGAVALNDCAARLTGDRAAGVVAALALSLAPCVIGLALPDAPLIAFWAASLALTVRMMQAPTPARAALLGLALAGALLSKMLGFALFAGVIAYALAREHRAVWSRGFALVPIVALAAYSPFLWWNLQHKWVSFIWAVAMRNGPLHHPSIGPALSVTFDQLGIYSPGLWLAAVAALFAARSALVRWTAAPLAILISVLSVFEPVKAHWMLGPYVSLCVGIGLGFVALRPLLRVGWTALAALPAGVALCLLLVAALTPQAIAATTFARLADMYAGDNGLAIFSYRLLASDARRAVATDAAVMTDKYGLAAAMAYYADLPAVVFGADISGRETRRWATLDPHVPRALIVSKAALHADSVFGPRLALACASVRGGPVLRYRVGDALAGVYYTTWCERPRPNALRILRWESDHETTTDF